MEKSVRGEGGAQTGTEGMNKAGNQGGEALEKVSQGNCGCPIPGSIQGQPGMVEAVLAHGARFSLKFLPVQTILGLSELVRAGWVMENEIEGDGSSHKSQNPAPSGCPRFADCVLGQLGGRVEGTRFS